MYKYERSCTTDDFYFSDLVTGKWELRHRILPVVPTIPGVKLWRETETVGGGGGVGFSMHRPTAEAVWEQRALPGAT